MRAIAYDRFGPAKDVLNEIDLPLPVPQAGEVLVQLVFSGVNPSDVKARAGLRQVSANQHLTSLCPIQTDPV